LCSESGAAVCAGRRRSRLHADPAAEAISLWLVAACVFPLTPAPALVARRPSHLASPPARPLRSTESVGTGLLPPTASESTTTALLLLLLLLLPLLLLLLLLPLLLNRFHYHYNRCEYYDLFYNCYIAVIIIIIIIIIIIVIVVIIIIIVHEEIK
jgi:hypothetical protein